MRSLPGRGGYLPRPSWSVRLGAAATAVVALGSAVLSWDALSWGAGQLGVDGRLTWLYPVVIDGTIGVATVCAVALRGSKVRIRAYVWTLLAGAIGASVVGNGAHAAGGSPIHVVGAAVPAVALAAALHLLVLLVRHAPRTEHAPELGDLVVAEPAAMAARVDQDDGAGDGLAPETAELRARIRADLAAAQDRLAGDEIARSARANGSRTSAKGARGARTSARTGASRAPVGERAMQMRALLAEPGGRALTGEELGARLGIHAGRARALRAEVERADAETGRRPHVVELEAEPAAAAMAEEA